MVTLKNFEFDARLNAKREGMSDISLALLPVTTVPPPREIEELKLDEQAAAGVIAGLSQRKQLAPKTEKAVEKTLTFSGSDYSEAIENMEKYFLQHRWSDGFPLVPPTQEAVSRMLEGTELPRDHTVALIEPGAGKATVEKIAVNAVMAGCLPQYMPVILAAVEAIADPRFDLQGVQCTAGITSPFLIISGQKLIKQLNVNYGFSAIGPGWRANSTIGRAVRLIMINIGHAWPGEPDMKSLGSPFKFVTLMAENDSAYGEGWEPIRVAEGFGYDEATISVMPAISWQPDYLSADVVDADKMLELLAGQGKVKYDNSAATWGRDNLVILTPSACETLRKRGLSRLDTQKALYELIKLPCSEFFEGRDPARIMGTYVPPEWLVKKCKEDPDTMVHLLDKPQNVKIIVAGPRVGVLFVYVGTWGIGPAYFVTKPIRLPPGWESLLEKYQGWDTPIVVKQL